MPVKRPCIERDANGRGCTEYAVDGGSRCAEHAREHQQKGWAEGRTGKRGMRPGWRAVREKVLREQRGKCKRCPAPATAVHHIDGVAANEDRSNLEGLCSDCHKIADREVRDAMRARADSHPWARARRKSR